MRVWCVGGGSIGLLFAAKLSLAGVGVTVVTRSEEQAEAIAREGIRLQEHDLVYQTAPSSISIDRLQEDGEFHLAADDWVLLTVKQQHLTEELIAELGRWCKTGSRLIAFQNGIGHVERLLHSIPSRQLDLAVTTEGARKISLTEVRHTGFGKTRMGSATDMVEAEYRENAGIQQKKLLRAMEQAGFESSLSNNMNEIAWNKLLMNAVINPLTALLQVPNGQLLALEPLMPLMRALFDEGVEIARSQGIEVEEDLWDQLLEVCHKTANNASSMLQDLLAGRSTEIDWLNGALLKAAKEKAIPSTSHETVYRLMKALELRKQQ